MIIIVESNERSDGTLTCSECGASGYQNLIRHLKSCHQMTPQEYLKRYPDDEVVKAKRDACLEAGYKFKFITQDELDNLSTKLLNV